jgi:hypothetical protein
MNSNFRVYFGLRESLRIPWRSTSRYGTCNLRQLQAQVIPSDDTESSSRARPSTTVARYLPTWLFPAESSVH